METNNQDSGVNKKIYLSIIVVLLLTNVFTMFQFFNERVATKDLTSEKIELQHEFSDLSDTLNARNTAVEEFMGKNAELDKTIAMKQVQMDNQKIEIKRLLAKGKLTQSELTKARNLIAEYKLSISDMTAQIADLTKKNEELMASNTQLSTDLNSEKATTSKLTEQNTGLSKKVAVGSLLQIANLDVAAIKTRNNGKEVEVKRAKVASNLRIKFETGENKVLDPGQVDLYVRIINPKGETIALADQGSGTIQAADAAEPIAYTKKAEIDYNQTNKTVVVYWGLNIQEPGKYKVELYQNGHVIGQGSVQLS